MYLTSRCLLVLIHLGMEAEVIVVEWEVDWKVYTAADFILPALTVP